jgi:hypothetical protein
MFQEDYGFPFHSAPPNGFYIQNLTGAGNRFYITGDYDPATKRGARVWEGPLTTGVWHDWLVHKKLTTDASGFLEVWLDGHPLTFLHGRTRLSGQHTMLAGARSANFSLMQYRAAGMFPMDRWPAGLTIYFDEARVGSTRGDRRAGSIARRLPEKRNAPLARGVRYALCHPGYIWSCMRRR